jgi:N-acetyl-gamma-glutamyl-phosphate reductase
MSKIKTAVIGAAGYTGGELLRLLIHHPKVEITCIHSNSQRGKKLEEVHPDLIGESDLVFTDQLLCKNLDAVFLCLPHGETRPFLEQQTFEENTVLIDLSTDFRDESEGFVYGLPETKKELLKKSNKIANPGCFATAIQLALLPAVAAGWPGETIHVTGITGSTGAGKKLAETSHFSYRNNNISVYKLFTHQHLKEIKQSFSQINEDFHSEILFVPYRGNFPRGIWITAYMPFSGTLSEALSTYREFYAEQPFTIVSEWDIDLKQVVNTNKCLLHLKKESGQLVIYAAIDNLLKGASGQAVQNLNLAFGWEEHLGLQLKSIGF